MKKLVVFLLLLSSVCVSAQDQDPKAKAILDDLSKITKSYKTILADVVFTMFNKDKKALVIWQYKGSWYDILQNFIEIRQASKTSWKCCATQNKSQK